MDSNIEKDFGDWLSPILVKEIRQGFRSRVFVSAFLLIQGLMIFCVVFGLALSSGDYNDTSNVYFWIIICFPLLLVMPAHGFGVLGSEIKGNTMELLFLTRLSAWRIVLGKWTAIVAQTVLIVCSILPYTVLRYFIGGVNLLDDLEALGWLLFASAILTGVAIAISPFYRSMLAKLMLPVFMIALIWFLAWFLNDHSFGGTNVLASTLLITAVLGPLFLLLMFEIAVGRIAPPAENHEFRKRVLGFLILGAIAVLNQFSVDTTALMILGMVLLLPVCITGLCEEIKPIPSIYLPFVKRGALGRLGGLLFYPGWPSAFLFTIFAFAAFVGIFFSGKQILDENGVLMVISMGGALLMPLAVTRQFLSKFNKVFVFYCSLQVFMIIVSILASAIKSTSLEGWIMFAAPLPTSTFFLAWFGAIDHANTPIFIVVQSLVLIASLIVLLIKCAAQRREIAALEQTARDTLMQQELPGIANANAA